MKKKATGTDQDKRQAQTGTRAATKEWVKKIKSRYRKRKNKIYKDTIKEIKEKGIMK